LTVLAPARAAFEAWGSVPELISTSLLAATARQALGDRDGAMADLATAVRLAAPGGYVRRFVDDGLALLPLLGMLDGAPSSFVAVVRAAVQEAQRPVGTARRGTSIIVTPGGELIESLTGRELEVLRHMATGARNAQLAADLGVTPGTAKWHVAHVLAKLGATSRTGAVVRAQELGLL